MKTNSVRCRIHIYLRSALCAKCNILYVIIHLVCLLSFVCVKKEMTLQTCETTIWSRFERKLHSGETIKFKILSPPRGNWPDVAEFMTKYYIHEEVWTKTCEVGKNPNAISEYKFFLHGFAEKCPPLVCYVDTDSSAEDQPLEIVGCNYLFIRKRNEMLDLKITSVELNKLMAMLIESDKLNTVCNKYDVDHYLCGAGISVDPNYRGCGIAAELLKARRPLCEQLGISVTGAAFTAVASQRAADKAGYEVVDEIDYNTFGQMCGVTFKTQSPSYKNQAMKIL